MVPDSILAPFLTRIAVALEKQNEMFDKQNTFYRESQRKTYDLNKKQADNIDIIETLSRRIVFLDEELAKAKDTIKQYEETILRQSRLTGVFPGEEKVTGGQESP